MEDTTTAKVCSLIQKSLGWCEGKASYPGVRRRLYYLSKSAIVGFPDYDRDDNGRPKSSELQGSFTLAADEKWKYIDILPAQSQLQSAAQGEIPSQTQLNTLTAFHPGTGAEATALSAYVNNTDCVYLVQDMEGNWRVLGNERWNTKSSVAQDLGQGPTGTAGTTLTAEVTDEMPTPIYTGAIVTEDGTINGTTGA